MSDLPGVQDAARLLVQLRRSEDARHQRVAGAELDPRMRLLVTWQAERLARTYADLVANPRYGEAMRFFLSDMYAPRDFSQRNHDVERMYNFLRRFLPERMLHILALVIELHYLTAELDEALLDVLVHQLGVVDTITAPLYAEAYRRCNNYDARLRQIDMIVEIGRGVDQLTRLPLTGTTLRVAGGPARRAGWSELHDFLQHGYVAFKSMHGADTFLRLIEHREKRILDRIYAGDAEPFRVD